MELYIYQRHFAHISLSIFVGGGLAFAAGSAASECGHADESVVSVSGSPAAGGVDTLCLPHLPYTHLLHHPLYTAPHPRRCVLQNYGKHSLLKPYKSAIYLKIYIHFVIMMCYVVAVGPGDQLLRPERKTSEQSEDELDSADSKLTHTCYTLIHDDHSNKC